jgi:alkylation response protein AidB-like acyl-CoA dehydrogenase
MAATDQEQNTADAVRRAGASAVSPSQASALGKPTVDALVPDSLEPSLVEPAARHVSRASVLAAVQVIATDFAEQRRERQARRALDPADFVRLAEAGFLLSGVPAEQGGLWASTTRSTRLVCELLRTLARGDSSVALVCAMHPTVLGFWLATSDAPEPFAAAWAEQRRAIFQTVLDGAWWGTITSEPGSGGDMMRTRAVARLDGNSARYRLSGDKQFGSGSGITAYMMTAAVPEGEEQPDLFYLAVRDVAWDGSTGIALVAPWDGLGMIATHSHAFRFEAFPATRAAWAGNLAGLGTATQPYVRCCFTAVCVGIVEEALGTARAQLQQRRASLRPYEQVEWARAELDGWLIQQAYEGMLRAVEANAADAALASVMGKVAIAELAESVLTRLCRVVGGGTYARSSPFGCWAQDVRALGFLRPPWGLAFDLLIEPTN